MGRRGYDLSGDAGARSDPLAAMAFPLLDTFMFAVLFLAAYFYRHRDRIILRRIYPVSIWAAFAIFLLDNLWFAVVVPNGAWHAVAAWLIR